MSQAKVYLGGLPTDADIQAIRKEFPDSSLVKGNVIHHAHLEKIINASKESNRYKGITVRWRKLVENESGIIIGSKRGIGFEVLGESEKLSLSHQKLRSATRMARRSYKIQAKIDRNQLSDDEKSRLDAMKARAVGILNAEATKTNPALPSLT